MSINTARAFIKETRAHPERFYVLHYSCQNLNDDIEGLSPRITSIAASHYSTQQTLSFSIHSTAELLGIAKTEVEAKIDEIEKALLQEFYNFVRERRDAYWVHWNMRNSTYGFEHIAHRYRALTGEDAPIIPVERRLNLNDLLADRYGSSYVPHPKMLKLMELNGGRHRDFLTGPDEVEAFNRREYIAMHKSTLNKVGFFQSVIRKLISGQLKTSTNGWGVMLDRLFESRANKLIGLIGAIFGIFASVFGLLSLI